MTHPRHNPDQPLEPDVEEMQVHEATRALEFQHLTATVAPTGAERFQMAVRLTSFLRESHTDIESFVILRNIKDIAEAASEALKEGALSEMEGKEMAVLGARVTVRGLREFDYSEDSELGEMEKKAAVLKKEIADRKSFLRNLKMEVADTATGVIIRPATCTKDGSTLAVTLPE